MVAMRVDLSQSHVQVAPCAQPIDFDKIVARVRELLSDSEPNRALRFAISQQEFHRVTTYIPQHMRPH